MLYSGQAGAGLESFILSIVHNVTLDVTGRKEEILSMISG